MVWELQGKAVTLVRLCLPFPPGSLWRGNGKGRMAGCWRQCNQRNSPSYFCPNAFSVWIIGPFREVAWKWLILAWEWSNQGATCEKGSSRSWGLGSPGSQDKAKMPAAMASCWHQSIHPYWTDPARALTVSNPGPASALRKCLLCIYREFPWW